VGLEVQVDNMKACKDCRYYIKPKQSVHGHSPTVALCDNKHSRTESLNFVDGDSSMVRMSCMRMRTSYFFCGNNAAFFEPKLTVLDKVKGFFK